MRLLVSQDDLECGFVDCCSDKIPRNDRVYVQAKEVQAAQEGKFPPVSWFGGNSV